MSDDDDEEDEDVDGPPKTPTKPRRKASRQKDDDDDNDSEYEAPAAAVEDEDFDMDIGMASLIFLRNQIPVLGNDIKPNDSILFRRLDLTELEEAELAAALCEDNDDDEPAPPTPRKKAPAPKLLDTPTKPSAGIFNVRKTLVTIKNENRIIILTLDVSTFSSFHRRELFRRHRLVRH